MMSVRLRKMHVTMAAALTAGLLGAGTASASDAPRGVQAQQQAPAVTSEAAVPTAGTRVDRTRPGRRQPAFDLRRLTPAPTQGQPAPNRPM